MAIRFERNSYLKFGDIIKTRILYTKLKIKYYKLFKNIKLSFIYGEDSYSACQISIETDEKGVKKISGKIMISPNQIKYLAECSPNIVKKDVNLMNKAKNKCSYLEFILLHELGHWVDLINNSIQFRRDSLDQNLLEEALSEMYQDELISYNEIGILYIQFPTEIRANKNALLLLDRIL